MIDSVAIPRRPSLSLSQTADPIGTLAVAYGVEESFLEVLTRGLESQVGAMVVSCRSSWR
jgi:hypothetical protein